jgi:hypothetical protein
VHSINEGSHAKTGTKGISLPNVCHVGINCCVMLVLNIINEMGLFNGAHGIVRDIIFHDLANDEDIIKYNIENGILFHKNEPNEFNVPICMIVEFPGYTGPAWDPLHPTYIPIVVDSNRCECSNCTRIGYALKVGKSITIHKSQGATYGKDHFWKCCVVDIIPPKQNTPGLQFVALSRPEKPTEIAIYKQPTLQELGKINSAPVTQNHRLYVDNKIKKPGVISANDRYAHIRANLNSSLFNSWAFLRARITKTPFVMLQPFNGPGWPDGFTNDEEELHDVEYEVESILGHKEYYGTAPNTVLKFLVKWVNCPQNQNTWEPRTSFGENNIVFNDYVQKNNL